MGASVVAAGSLFRLARRGGRGVVLLLVGVVALALALGFPAQLPHPGLDLVDKAEVVVITDDGSRSHGQTAFHERPHRSGAQIAEPESAQADAGQVEGE